MHLTRTDRIVEALIPAVLEQKVAGIEARRAYLRLVRATSEPAPGPAGLLLPPTRRPSRRSPTTPSIRSGWSGAGPRCSASSAGARPTIEELSALPGAEARGRLQRFPGIGPWTAAEVARLALADADAVSVGDYHLPHVVAWALAREPRGTDERMLKLLEPYRGHRGRVQRILEAGGVTAPRYGPRMRARTFERI